VDVRELAAMTEQYLPAEFQRRVLHGVYMAHQVSVEHVRAEFAASEAVNLLPYYRRAKLEGYLRDAAERSGIAAAALKSSGSGWFHTEVRNGAVVLTASTVQTPCGPVDPSEFRLSLAEENPLYLWEEPGDVAADEPPLYALLLHSRSVWQTPEEEVRYGGLPGSAYLAFPASGLETYLYTINLFEAFPDIVESYMPREWDTEAKIRYIHNGRRLSA
jgi:hypothetical protein